MMVLVGEIIGCDDGSTGDSNVRTLDSCIFYGLWDFWLINGPTLMANNWGLSVIGLMFGI